MRKRTLFFICMVLLVGALLASCGSSSTSATTIPATAIPATEIPATTLPATSISATSAPTAESNTGSTLDGQALMQERCTVCHSLDRVESKHQTADQWKKTVDRMISNGAQLTPQEEQVLVDYLAQTYK